MIMETPANRSSHLGEEIKDNGAANSVITSNRSNQSHVGCGYY